MSRVARANMSLRVRRIAARRLYAMQGTGLPRIADAIRRRTARWAATHRDEGTVWIDDFCGAQHFCCDLAEHMGSLIYFKGSYSSGQLVVLRQLLSADSVFVDVGANQGEFTVCAAGSVPQGQVFAFEPVPGARKRLQRNVTRNIFDNVTIYAVGLSDCSRDDVSIFGADSEFSDGTENIGLPTLFDVAGRSEVLARINLRRLDEMLSDGQRVDVIKVDVEGAELAVLRGAEATIRHKKPDIMFEANEETCEAAGYSVDVLCEWLTRIGYELEVIGPAGELMPAGDRVRFCNMLARHPEKKDVQQRTSRS